MRWLAATVAVLAVLLASEAAAENETQTFCSSDAECGNVDCGGRTSDKAKCDGDKRCQCEPRAYFFLVFGLYLMVILGISVYSFQMAKKQRRERGSSEGDETAHAVMRDYFMPDAKFGITVMALTIFSTTTSGYSIVGVPNEAATQGFVALRWLLVGVPVGISMAFFYPRFRAVGLTRNYASPADLITDRFRSQKLRLTATAVMVFVLFVYTAAQFKAIYDIIDVISLGRIDAKHTTILVAVVIILCDWIGGQRGVSLSDALQAIFMIVAFLTVPFFLTYYFRDMRELAHHCEDQTCLEKSRPYILMTPTVTGMCDFKNRATDRNCLFNHYIRNAPNASVAQEDWDRYLNEYGGINVDILTDFDHEALSMFGFIVNGFAFPMQAPFVQKIFLARDTRAVKFALMFVTVGTFVITIPSLYYGLLAATEFPTEQVPAYPLTVGKLMNENGFAQFVAVIALNAVIAAVMSTADSTVIGANNIFSVTWIKGFLLPGKSPRLYTIVSMSFSAFFALSACLFSIDVDTYFATLLNLQNSVNWQIIPTFVVALYSDRVAAHPLLYGMLAGLAICVILELNVKADQNFVGTPPTSQHYTDGTKAFNTRLPSGIWGAMVNVLVVATSQYTLSAMGSPLADDTKRTTDQPYQIVTSEYGGTRLTAKMITDGIIDPETEPYASRLCRVLVAVQFGLLFFGLPWYDNAYSEQDIYSAFPAWASFCMTCGCFAFAIQLYVLAQWQTSDGSAVEELRPNAALASINAEYDEGEDADDVFGEEAGVDVQHGLAAPPGPTNPFVGLAGDGNASSA